jgi:hypothetical protein
MYILEYVAIPLTKSLKKSNSLGSIKDAEPRSTRGGSCEVVAMTKFPIADGSSPVPLNWMLEVTGDAPADDEEWRGGGGGRRSKGFDGAIGVNCVPAGTIMPVESFQS